MNPSRFRRLAFFEYESAVNSVANRPDEKLRETHFSRAGRKLPNKLLGRTSLMWMIVRDQSRRSILSRLGGSRQFPEHGYTRILFIFTVVHNCFVQWTRKIHLSPSVSRYSNRNTKNSYRKKNPDSSHRTVDNPCSERAVLKTESLTHSRNTNRTSGGCDVD